MFLISPDSVASGRYTLSELELAKEKWSHPRDRVLPVMVRPTPKEGIPPYLKAVTILHPRGSAAAEVTSAVQALVTRSSEGNEVPGIARRASASGSIPAAIGKVKLVASYRWFLVSPQIVIFIDNKEVTRMKLGDQVTVEVESGDHTIFAKMPLNFSNTATFDLKPGRTQTFTVSVTRVLSRLKIEPS